MRKPCSCLETSTYCLKQPFSPWGCENIGCSGCFLGLATSWWCCIIWYLKWRIAEVGLWWSCAPFRLKMGLGSEGAQTASLASLSMRATDHDSAYRTRILFRRLMVTILFLQADSLFIAKCKRTVIILLLQF